MLDVKFSTATSVWHTKVRNAYWPIFILDSKDEKQYSYFDWIEKGSILYSNHYFKECIIAEHKRNMKSFKVKAILSRRHHPMIAPMITTYTTMMTATSMRPTRGPGTRQRPIAWKTTTTVSRPGSPAYSHPMNRAYSFLPFGTNRTKLQMIPKSGLGWQIERYEKSEYLQTQLHYNGLQQ